MALSPERIRELARHYSRARLAAPTARITPDANVDKRAREISHAIMQRRRAAMKRENPVQRISSVG